MRLVDVDEEALVEAAAAQRSSRLFIATLATFAGLWGLWTLAGESASAPAPASGDGMGLRDLLDAHACSSPP